MRDPILLDEYGTALADLDHDGARALADIAGSHLDVTVGPRVGSWQITARGAVGAIVTSDVRVLIRPKIPLANLFQLLGVGIPDEAWWDASFGFATDPDLLTAMATFFVRSAARALLRGARRDYRAEEDRLVALRGRIDIAAQFRTPGMLSPIACRFDEYSADIPENKAICAAVHHLLRLHGVQPEIRARLERLLLALVEVPDQHIGPEAIDRIPVTRLNRHYAPALRLASVILRNTALLDRVGRVEASAFLLDMPALFQRWMADRLRRHLAGRLHLDPEPTVHLALGRRVPMAPDLLFETAGRVAYVADVKYKLSSGLALGSDYYQLLAYTTALDLREGALLYCQTAQEPPARQVVVKNCGTELWTYRVPMTGTHDDLESAVANLADWICDRSLMANSR